MDDTAKFGIVAGGVVFFAAVAYTMSGWKKIARPNAQTCHHLSPRQLNILKQAGNVRPEALDDFFREPLTFTVMQEVYSDTLDKLGECAKNERNRNREDELEYRKTLLKASDYYWNKEDDESRNREYSKQSLSYHNLQRERDELLAIMMREGIK